LRVLSAEPFEAPAKVKNAVFSVQSGVFSGRGREIVVRAAEV
jgi:hypothetical protein